ncbi:MAG: hypothetical protein ACP5HK_03795 [Acidilobus sp.]
MRKHVDKSFRESGVKNARKLVAWINFEDYTPNTRKDVLVMLKRFYQWLRAPQNEYPQWVRRHQVPRGCRLDHRDGQGKRSRNPRIF